MKNLLSIGAFSRISRLSVRTLRRYHEQGLLPPHWVDPDTDYRYYRAAQLHVAEQIRLLRTLDLPLADVRKILETSDWAPVQATLEAHGRRIEARIAEQQRALRGLRDLLSTPAGRLAPYVVRQDQRPTTWVVARRRRTHIEDLGTVFGTLLGELFADLGQRGLTAAGPPLSLYDGDGFGPDNVDLLVGVPVPERTPGATDISGGPVLTTVHVGPYETIHRAHTAVVAWAEAEQVALTGAAWESYQVGPTQVPDRSDYRTEVAWLVEAGIGA